MPISTRRPDARRLSAPSRLSSAALGGFTLATATGVALSVTIAAGPPILAARWRILALLGVWALAWIASVACALRLPRRVALGAMIAGAVALRLAALAGPPTLSDDLYRYSWDGRVEAAGVDPYRYSPSSVHLASIRERWLWPGDAGCAALNRPPGCTRINRPTVRTIYPPLAEAWFAAVYRVAGIGAHHKPWQVAGLLTDLALVALLPAALRAWGRDERWTALYALSPFPVVEVVNNGHVDGLAALLAVVALVLAARRRPGWAGAFLGAAALVKLYPALFVLALAAAGMGRLRSLVTAAAAALAVVAAGYLPHVVAVGWRVVGYLPGYLREEHYADGGRYLLAGSLPLALAGVGAVGAWVVARRWPVPHASAALLGALLLATSPVQPWYAVVLVAVATVAVEPAWFLVAAAGYPYFFAVILDASHPVAAGRLSYGVALAGLVAAAGAAHHRSAPVATASAVPSAGFPSKPLVSAGGVALVLVLAGPVAGVVARQRSVGIPPLPVLGAARDAYDGDLGDPFILHVDEKGATRFVAFGTGDFPARVPTAVTTDLVHWDAGHDALPVLPSWAGADPRNSLSWAPAVLAVDGHYVLYITLPEARSGRQCIAAATSVAPEGPYADSGAGPLLCQRELGGSIDPSVVKDRAGGLHLLWKSDGNSVGKAPGLWEQAMAADGLHMTGEAHLLLSSGRPWEGGIVEEPAALPAGGGGWWLFYSGNRFDTPAYGTGVAWCAELSGPCQETTGRPVLATEGTRYAPGGLETFQDVHGETWAVFDTWNRPARNGIFRCCRSLYLAKVERV